MTFLLHLFWYITLSFAIKYLPKYEIRIITKLKAVSQYTDKDLLGKTAKKMRVSNVIKWKITADISNGKNPV